MSSISKYIFIFDDLPRPLFMNVDETAYILNGNEPLNFTYIQDSNLSYVIYSGKYCIGVNTDSSYLPLPYAEEYSKSPIYAVILSQDSTNSNQWAMYTYKQETNGLVAVYVDTSGSFQNTDTTEAVWSFEYSPSTTGTTTTSIIAEDSSGNLYYLMLKFVSTEPTIEATLKSDVTSPTQWSIYATTGVPLSSG